MTSSSTGRARAPRRPAAKTATAPLPVRPGAPAGFEQPDDPAQAPAGRRDLIVLKLDALTKEARDEHVAIDIDGRVFVLANAEELNWLDDSQAAALAVASGDLRPRMKLLLGDQYEEFEKLPLTLAQINGIFSGWSKHHGINVPESDASQDS